MNFITSIFNNRNILLNLIRSDFKNRYLGNHLGIIWAFIQPLVMIMVYWFVFTYGLRAGAIDNKIPFILWLMCGLVPWFFLSDALISSSQAIVSQSFLVKKIVFEVKLLPVVKLGSALIVNLAFWIVLIVYLVCYGYYPNFYWLQIFYYLFCIFAFILSLGLLLSAVTVFMLDVGQFVSIVMQIMMWVTPIMWNYNILPHKFLWVVKLNPFAYIVNGVRDALLYHKPFWVHYNVTIYFWVLTLAIFIVATRVFNKLSPHFADVL